MKVLIKGAGDLASGIACRLFRCGLEIIMTDIEVPTTVRRTVAFSRAVYEETVQVEGIGAKLARQPEEIEVILSERKIAVVVDPMCRYRDWYRADVVVDAILAKKNLGTTIKDAPIVIGVGPGFDAGADCHCVVETKRGHYLGQVIHRGSAIPNTGIPGEIGGYSRERLIQAQADGIFMPEVEIGEVVKRGQMVGSSGQVPIYAQMDGMVRGILQQQVPVYKGMKCGDIDSCCELKHCFTVSDKARAIGGGVLEAIFFRKSSCFEK